MQTVCLQCHGQDWVDRHYQRLDAVVAEYNGLYFKPALARMGKPAATGERRNKATGDREKQAAFLALWHRHGRQARMGAAMMAPDFSWWHGFYECKKDVTKLW